jgi:CubicO group peptidase (beta-lactamase class C family)
MRYTTLIALLMMFLFSLKAETLSAQKTSLQNLKLTEGNADEFFDQLEREGYSGVVYLKLNQIEILKRPFGMANDNLNIQNQLTTVFDIGSRPFDFTKASILLLDQRNEISMDDPISLYFDNVPVDKQSMRIHHLMAGQSGLPDFKHSGSRRTPITSMASA